MGHALRTYHSIAKAGNKSRRDKLSQTVGGALDGSANNHNRAADHDRTFATKQIPEPDRSDSPEETCNMLSTSTLGIPKTTNLHPRV